MPLWLFRFLLRRKILFVDIFDHLQLRTKLLVTPEANFIAVLDRPAAFVSGEQNFGRVGSTNLFSLIVTQS